MLDLVHGVGALRCVGLLLGKRRLTVLTHHRVVEFDHPGFDTFRRNVSATPGEFH